MIRLSRRAVLVTVGALVATATALGPTSPAHADASQGPVLLTSVSTGTGSAPVAVAVTPNGARAYVTNSGTNTVSIVSTATNSIDASITGLNTPQGIAITPNGQYAYVTNATSNTVSVIDTATNAIDASITGLNTPQGIAINPAGTRAYVANSGNNTVSVITTATNSIDATVTGLHGPHSIAITPNGQYAYATNATSNTVSVINAATNAVDATVTGLNAPQGIAITPDGTRAYVANSGSNTVSVIDTSTNTIIGTLTATLPQTALTSPRAVAVSPSGTYLYVSHNSTAVAKFATATNTQVADTDALSSGNLIGLAVSPDGSRIYGAAGPPDSLAVFSTGERVSCTYSYAWPGGVGTTASPYQVASQSDLDAVRHCPSSAFRQTQDIALTGTWTPIGTTAVSFNGDYDGDGHAISGLLLNDLSAPVGQPTGLFGMGQGASIRDLRISDGQGVVSRDTIGLLVGNCEACQVTSVEVSGSVASTGNTVGGLAGMVSELSTTVSQSTSAAVVTGLDSTGGLIGLVRGATVSDSCATGPVTGTTRVGGLVGDSYDFALLTQTCATGAVSGTQYVGGLVGSLAGGGNWPTPVPGASAYINRSFASGSVTASHGTVAHAGGLVGGSLSHALEPGDFSIADSYASGSVTGVGVVGGLVGSNRVNEPLAGRSYAVGIVNGGASNSTGGFVGSVITGTVSNFASDYWNVGTTGRPFGVGGLGSTTTGLNLGSIIDLSTEQMRSSQNFSGWDFTTVWGYDCQQSFFPLLRWKVPTATATTSDCPSPGPQNPSSPTAIPTSSASPEASTSPASTTVPDPPFLRPGRARAAISGVAVPVRTTTLGRGKGVAVRMGSMRFTLRSTTPSGQRVPTAPNGALVIARAGTLPITGEGVATGSEVSATLYSDPTSLGPTTASTSGSFTSRPRIPGTVQQGTHTLSLTGLTSSGAPFTLDLGVTVASPVAALGAHPVVTVSPRPAEAGERLSIRAVGVQSGCLVDFTLGPDSTRARASARGQVEVALRARARDSVLTTRVHGKGCTVVRLGQRVNVR